MKQDTIIRPETFQTITTLETQCAKCGGITRHVAHATQAPPLDAGISFSSSIGKSGVSFLDYERIIQRQADQMSEMSRRHTETIADKNNQIRFLESIINKFGLRMDSIDDDEP